MYPENTFSTGKSRRFWPPYENHVCIPEKSEQNEPTIHSLNSYTKLILYIGYLCHRLRHAENHMYSREE